MSVAPTIMKVDVYETSKPNSYLLLPHGALLSAVPRAVIQPLGTPRPWKTVELNGQHLAGADPSAIRADLQSRGYSVREIQIRVSEGDNKCPQCGDNLKEEAIPNRTQRQMGSQVVTKPTGTRRVWLACVNQECDYRRDTGIDL